MPNLNEKFAEVEALKQGWLQDQNLVNQYIGGEQQLPYMLQQELGKRMPNLALRKQENMLQEQLTTTPTNYATKYPDIKNPLLAGQLAAQREASIERNLQDVRATRQQQEGTVSDIINAATGAYKSKTERLRAQVATKQAQYEAGFGEYKQLSAEEETRKQQELNKKNFEEQIREFDIKQAEDKRQFEEKMKLSYAELRKSGSNAEAIETEKNQKELLSALGFLGTKIKYDGSEVKFEDKDSKTGAITYKTREEAAYDLAAQVGISYDEAKKKLYENFPEMKNAAQPKSSSQQTSAPSFIERLKSSFQASQAKQKTTKEQQKKKSQALAYKEITIPNLYNK